MLSNFDIESNIHSTTNQQADTFFLNRPYYTSLLQCLELREIKDDTTYLLTHIGSKNWHFDLEHISESLIQLQLSEGLKSQEIVSILEFILAKLDRSKSTPQYIRSFMCREVLTRVILQRFNECLGRKFTSLTDLSYHINDNIIEANEIFNSIRICDPAMGSGAFLRTLLNEIIAIKSHLGILADSKNNPLIDYKILLDGDELRVLKKKQFRNYIFDPTDPESFRIHETLFLEKSRIIEQNLFGVDIDKSAVSICKLRLWIDLIKHACWNSNAPFIAPRFEGNIRHGDSLISRFSLQEDLRNLFKRIGYSPSDYKNLAQEYKQADSKEEKNKIGQLIAMIKKKLQLEIAWDDRNNEDLLKWERELATLKTPSLFDMDVDEKKAMKNKLLVAQSMVDKFTQKIESVKNNPIYEQAIEWRYEFPELLNDSGDFIGFDIIISNPPDTQSQLMAESIDIYKQLSYRAYKHTGDVSSLFYELGSKLLKTDYYLSFIASNSWMKSVVASKMRQYLMEETSPLLMIEFNQSRGIENVLSEQAVITLQKARNIQRMLSCQVKDDFDSQESSFEDYVNQYSTLSSIDTNGSIPSITAFSVLSDIEKQIKSKIEQTGTPLESWDIQMYSGIKTGYDSAFIIDGKTKDEFVLADYKNVDIIKPLLPGDNVLGYLPERSDQWLIYIPWHFPLLYDKTIKTASERAEQRFRQQYPIIYEYLSKFKDELISRDSQEVGVIFEWYALQRYGTSTERDDFSQQKIVWKRESVHSNFCFDYSGCAILETNCFMTGQHLKYLLGVLNSKLGKYMLRDSPRLSNGDMQISILTLEALKVPIPNIKIESEVISLINKRTTDVFREEYQELEKRIDQLIFDTYELNQEERDFIENNIS